MQLAISVRGRLAPFLVALIALFPAAPIGHAAPTRVSISRAAPELAGLAACIATKAQNSGPVVPMEGLVEGVEFRMLLQADPGAPGMLIIEGLLKPDVAGLVESLQHHDDPEAQPAAATRFFHLLRIPVGTRAWVWRPEREAALCSEAAGWIAHLRSRPVLFDRLAPDGEPH